MPEYDLFWESPRLMLAYLSDDDGEWQHGFDMRKKTWPSVWNWQLASRRISNSIDYFNHIKMNLRLEMPVQQWFTWGFAAINICKGRKFLL